MSTLHPIPPDLLISLVEGAADLVKTPKGLVPWRLPSKHAAFYHPQLLESLLATTGIRLRFTTTSRAFRLEFDQRGMKGVEPEAVWDVYVNGELYSRQTIAADPCASLALEDLPAGSKEIIVYFPTNSHITLKGLSSDAPISETKTSCLHWITHGSSLTHCRSAAGPGETWPAIVARQAGWSFRNLGFAG